MIYMVDHIFTDPALEPAWHEWYAGYLQKLVSVPGLHSAQRFKALGHTPSRYLAMYSIDSADVYASEAYKNIGGGGSQSARFHSCYQLWTRNLFGGAPAAPLVRDGQRVMTFDCEQPGERSELGSLESSVWLLNAVGLHMTTKYRGIAVLDAGAPVPEVAGSILYEPFTTVLVAK